jgi:hypothetical protein
MKSGSRAGRLLQSGLIFSAISFFTGLGNLGFQMVLGNNLPEQGQYSHANSAINGFMPLLGLPSQVAIFAVTHYIAHFNAIGDTARLQGLLAGSRKFLLQLTLFGSLLAIIIIKPLGLFLNFNTSLVLVTLICTLLGLFTTLATALCQGLSWFKRLAFIGFLVMVLRVSFGWFVTLKWPSPEMAVIASTFALLAYLVVLFWRKELALPKQTVATPLWNREFVLYLVVSAAFVIGNYCFSMSDLLVMQHYSIPGHFTGADSDAYTAAERFAISLPITVAPLLTVLFTNRSVEHSKDALGAQMKLIGLYAAGLVFGAVSLFVARHLCLRLLGQDTPEAAEMILHLAVTMVFVGLLQAVGTWALASRWSRISLLYGVLGIGYTALILVIGKTPHALLRTMPVAAATAFLILFVVWIMAMRRHKPVV